RVPSSRWNHRIYAVSGPRRTCAADATEIRAEVSTAAAGTRDDSYLRRLHRANDSDAEPRSGSTFPPRDAQRRAKRAAEAAGQQAPLRRLLQRVRRRPPG